MDLDTTEDAVPDEEETKANETTVSAETRTEGQSDTLSVEQDEGLLLTDDEDSLSNAVVDKAVITEVEDEDLLTDDDDQDEQLVEHEVSNADMTGVGDASDPLFESLEIGEKSLEESSPAAKDQSESVETSEKEVEEIEIREEGIGAVSSDKSDYEDIDSQDNTKDESITTPNNEKSDIEIIQDDEKVEESVNAVDDLEAKGNSGDEKKGENSETESDEGMPMIRMNSNIFEPENENEDDDDDDDALDPEAIQSMMEIELNESKTGSVCTSKQTPKKQRKSEDEKLIESYEFRRYPRRQAAVVASNTIKKISNLEKQVRYNDDDPDYVEYLNTVPAPGVGSSRPSSGEHKRSHQHVERDKEGRCHQCKQYRPSLVVVRQYGTDIHLCSKVCFNNFRHPDPAFKPLPCCKCGALGRDSQESKTYFWETMSFCSDLCIGNFQLQIGSGCATCCKKTPWTSMGKYCVRFGSDVRQFCAASCLENYKRNARVCFHCQLDIKKLGNIVVASIPSRSSAKEFCSQDCVEQYIDQNVTDGSRSKSVLQITCHICRATRLLYRELVTSNGNFKVCCRRCWDSLLNVHLVRSPAKCQTCTKFLNMDAVTVSPTLFVGTPEKVFGFCSATCKNVYVLKTRLIRPCTTCQVKKYNYDLIQLMEGRVESFAVCSLNCLPKPSAYILALKDKISQPHQVSTLMHPLDPTRLPVLTPVSQNTYSLQFGNGTPAFLPSSQQSPQVQAGRAPQPTRSQTSSIAPAIPNGHLILNADGNLQLVEGASCPTNDVTVRQAGECEVIEIHDDDEEENEFPVNSEMCADGSDKGLPSGLSEFSVDTEDTLDEEGSFIEDPNMDDNLWGQCQEIIIIRPPKPVPQRNKACQVRPIRITKETETDISELNLLPRIEHQPRVIFIPVPIPIPIPIFITNPAPVPFPAGIPVPIPIPIICNETGGDREMADEMVNENQTNFDSFEAEMMDTSEPQEIESVETDQECQDDSEKSTFLVFHVNSPVNVGSPGASSSSASAFQSSSPVPGSPSVLGKGRLGKPEYALRAWKLFFGEEDPALLSPDVLAEKLMDWLLRGTKPKGDRYEPHTFLYYFLGIQQQLRNAGRSDQLFYSLTYSSFVETFTAYVEQEMSRGCCISNVEEENVWDAGELGPICPGVLLFTFVYFFYKYFGLKTWEELGALDSTQVIIRDDSDGERKYITLADKLDGNGDLIRVYDVPESPHRCPVTLLRFYLCKCETKEGKFFKAIHVGSKPTSAWYSVEALSKMDLYRMLVRAQMICITNSD